MRVACFVLILLPLACWAQEGKQVQILNADQWVFDNDIEKNAQRLIGHVRFQHKSVLMDCDSAYLFGDNKVRAFGRVHIRQGDTLDIRSALLDYDPATSLAQLSGNVRLKDPDMLLTTEQLDYNMQSSVAHYHTGGTILSEAQNTVLFSKRGAYHSEARTFFFSDSVRLQHPEYLVSTDTLRYHTATEVAWFLGPSTIVQDSSFIYCENGWYDTKNDISSFEEHAYVVYKDQRLEGDSLYYDRNDGLGQVFGNVQVTDTVNDLMINGDIGQYNEKTDISWVTGHAVMTQFFTEDSLFLHGDTLISVPDSIGKQRSIRAYNGVRFFKPDMQGKCDSLIWSETDSTLRMYHEPVLWSEKNQIVGEFIDMRIFDGTIDRLFIRNHAFIISQADSIRFNQIKGRKMTGFFNDNDLRKVLVEGNGQTLYYAVEESNDTLTPQKILGVNWAECSNILIFIGENEIERISFLTKPNMTLYPDHKLPDNKKSLEGFRWEVGLRPNKKSDIFN